MFLCSRQKQLSFENNSSFCVGQSCRDNCGYPTRLYTILAGCCTSNSEYGRGPASQSFWQRHEVATTLARLRICERCKFQRERVVPYSCNCILWPRCSQPTTAKAHCGFRSLDVYLSAVAIFHKPLLREWFRSLHEPPLFRERWRVSSCTPFTVPLNARVDR